MLLLLLPPIGAITGWPCIGQGGAIGGAAWVALYAPVLGLAAKQTSNETSLDERADATAAGLRALTTTPLGGQGTEKQAGINLISDVAVNGLPFVLLVGAVVAAGGARDLVHGPLPGAWPAITGPIRRVAGCTRYRSVAVFQGYAAV